nr:hypothetical protein CFP56_68390 [Quercus suber]
MLDEVGRELGNNIGKFIEVDRRARQLDQAKFMRIRADLQLDKPLRRGGKIASVEGEKFWNPKQYGEWLQAQGNPKMGLEKSRSTNNGDQEEGSSDWFEENNVATTKLSFASMSGGGDGPSGRKGDWKNSILKISKRLDVSEGDKVQGATRAHSTQMEHAIDVVSEARDLSNYSFSGFPRGVIENKSIDDALSLVG